MGCSAVREARGGDGGRRGAPVAGLVSQIPNGYFRPPLKTVHSTLGGLLRLRARRAGSLCGWNGVERGRCWRRRGAGCSAAGAEGAVAVEGRSAVGRCGPLANGRPRRVCEQERSHEAGHEVQGCGVFLRRERKGCAALRNVESGPCAVRHLTPTAVEMAESAYRASARHVRHVSLSHEGPDEVSATVPFYVPRGPCPSRFSRAGCCH